MLTRRLRKGLLAIFMATLVFWVGSAGDMRPSTIDLAVAPYRHSVINWEVANFLDKWWHKLGDIMPWRSLPNREERIAQAEEFFELGRMERDLGQRLLFRDRTTGLSLSPTEAATAQANMAKINKRRGQMQADVEETIESEVSAILKQMGFASRIGLIFPPVDAVFARSPGVLITSPRDRIAREETVLLKADISDQEREKIEQVIFEEEGLSAIVQSTGGVALYPSVVTDSSGLHFALEITAHEWLHHWFFFNPLGQHMWDTPEMNTLNETAATIGGQLIGDLAYTAMTGEVVNRPPPSPPTAPDPHAFDFNAEMRETRRRAEELLAQDKIEEAESYMEERRQLMVANGYLIRKLNQAYFAFHGTYGTSAASVSPIGDQMRQLQQQSESIADFLKTMASFGSYQQFLDSLE